MDSPALVHVQTLLRRKHQSPHDNDVLQQFLVEGMEFLVGGNEKCWWCTPAKRPIATELLHILSFQDQTSKVVSFKTALAEQLTRCTSCIACYYESKMELREHLKKVYMPENVEAFFLGIEQWDTGRIMQSLGRSMIGDSATGLIVLFDVLCSAANLLYYPDVAKATTKFIVSRIDSGSPPNTGARLLPGIIALSVCDDVRIQQWAWRSLKQVHSKHSPVSAKSIVDIFAGLFTTIASDMYS
ncbi:DEAD-box type RNA helicase, partial [Coemansia aciculifera]